MISYIVEIFENVANLLEMLFTIIYILGGLISFLIGWLVQTLFAVCQRFIYVLNIFYEDFAIFAKDIFDIVNLMSAVGERLSASSVAFIKHFFTFIYELSTCTVTNTKLTISGAGKNMYFAFGEMISSTKEYIILVGNSVWLLITFVPTMLLLLCRFLYELITTSIQFSAQVMLDMFHNFLFGMRKSVIYVVDIPFQSACGILFIIVLIHYRRTSLYIAKYLLISLFKKCIVPITLRVYREILHYLQGYQGFRILLRWWHCSTRFSKTQNSGQNGNNTKKGSRDTDNSSLCVICQDNEKCVVLFPCKHMCMCNDCAANLVRYDNHCPLCRIVINRRINVFV